MTEKSVFVIPERKKNALTSLSSLSQSLLCGVPEALRKHAQSVISDLETDAFNNGLKYITTLSDTYLFLMEQISRSMGGTLVAHLVSEYANLNSYHFPTLEKWKENNPAKNAALHIVELDLRKKGWEPVVILSSHTYCSEKDCYEGGNQVILSCSLVD